MGGSGEINVETEDIVAQTGDLPIVKGQRITAADPRPAQRPRIGHYRLLARFNSSDWTHVFLGERETVFGVRRLAVVKVTARQAPNYGERKTMLFDEMRTMALLDHPNIANMIEAGEAPSGCYVVTEYVSGDNLNSILHRATAAGLVLAPAIGCFIVVEVLRALEHAHTTRDSFGHPLQLVHRDVTPSNILVARTGHVKLCDFGVARVRERFQAPTAPGLVKGKLSYLAPEYALGGEIDHRVDIYGVGVVLAELLAGKKAFKANDGPAVLKTIVHEGLPKDLLAAIPNELRAIVERATARDPKARYDSAAAFGEALEAYLGRKGLYVSPSSVAATAAAHDLIRSPVLE